jgi:hypothetical protein
MLNSLRSKLIAAFAFVIFVCLFSVGAAFVLFLRGHETDLAREHVGRLAEPMALRTYLEWWSRAGGDAFNLTEYAERMGVRVSSSTRKLLDRPRYRQSAEAGSLRTSR